MKPILLVFLGGGAGSVLRYLLSGAMARLPASQAWDLPWGTLACNALASLLLGFLAAFAARGLPQAAWLLLAVGVCGGWSTFSTFSMECVLLFRDSKLASGSACIALNLLLSLAGFLVPLALLAPAATAK